MKSRIFAIGLFMSVVYAALFGAALSLVAPVDPTGAGLAFFATRSIYLFVLKGEQFSGLTLAGVNKEIWIDALKENFYSPVQWLDGVVDWSQWVEYNTINFTVIGTDPVILKDNASWPITAVTRTDTNSTLVLSTYDSTTTRVRNVEEIEAAINKLQSAVKQHKQKLLQEVTSECMSIYAPATAAAGATAVTGANRAAVIGSQSTVAGTMTLADLAFVKERWDNLDFPTDGRVGILSPFHLSDLNRLDATLTKEFMNVTTGKPVNLYGFEMYTGGNVPLYTKSTLAKKTYGAAADNTNDCVASIFFAKSEVGKAMGDVEMFWRKMETNPEQRADEIGFQMRFKGLAHRTTNFYQQALVSNRA